MPLGALVTSATFPAWLQAPCPILPSHHVLVRQRAGLLLGRRQGGAEQRRVVPVRAVGHDPQRDPAGIGGDRAFQPLLAPVDR
jgi:hypothetical protein